MAPEEMMEVELDILAIRCSKCGGAEASTRTDDYAAFIRVHQRHCDLLLVAKITAPPELVSGQLVELEFTKEAQQ